MKTAVITVVHGRTTHLRSHQPSEQHVIVAVEDSTLTRHRHGLRRPRHGGVCRAPALSTLGWVPRTASFLPMGGDCRRRVER
jgi:hypothetical protein